MSLVYLSIYNDDDPFGEEPIHIAKTYENESIAERPKKFKLLRKQPKHFLCGKSVSESVNIGDEVSFTWLDEMTHRMVREHHCKDCLKNYDEEQAK